MLFMEECDCKLTVKHGGCLAVDQLSSEWLGPHLQSQDNHKKKWQRFSKPVESGTQKLIPNFENVVNVQHKEMQVISQRG